MLPPHLSLGVERRKKPKLGIPALHRVDLGMGDTASDVTVGMWSPAAQGTVPTAQQTCGVGGVGADPFWGAHREFCVVG